MFCKAPGLPQEESSIDLTEHEPSSTIAEGEELDLNEAYDQLEMMKQRILQMKSMIIRSPPTPVDPVQEEFEKLANSENAHLREIQQETSLSFHQIELVRNRLAETTKELAFLAERIQEVTRCTKKLAKKLDEVPQWMEELQHQSALCLERYNELDTTCCSDLDYSNHMRPLLVTLSHNEGSRISKACYEKQYIEISNHVKETRMLLNKTHDKLVAFTQALNNSLLEATPQPHPVLSELFDLIGLLERKTSLTKPKEDIPKHKSRRSIELATAVSKLKLLKLQ